MKTNAITSCQSKKSYSSKAEADEVGAWLWLEKEVEVYSYKCQICEMWHLSSK